MICICIHIICIYLYIDSDVDMIRYHTFNFLMVCTILSVSD